MIDERTTFRGLTFHESEVVRVALSNLVTTCLLVPPPIRRSAQLMLDQKMYQNFLWAPEGQQRSEEIIELKDKLKRAQDELSRIKFPDTTGR